MEKRSIDVLRAIEEVVCDDFCLEIDMLDANGELTPREKRMQEKLSLIYKMAHSHDKRHVCHDVHEDWRKLVQPKPPSSRSAKDMREAVGRLFAL